jgi:hypothetical protein
VRVETLYKPLEVSVLVATEATPLGEYKEITFSAGMQVALVDHHATAVAGSKGLQYVGSIKLVSFNTRDAKQLDFFVSKQAFDEAIIPPPLDEEK